MCNFSHYSTLSQHSSEQTLWRSPQDHLGVHKVKTIFIKILHCPFHCYLHTDGEKPMVVKFMGPPQIEAVVSNCTTVFFTISHLRF